MRNNSSKQARTASATLALLAGLGLAGTALGQHPGPQPMPGPSTQTLSADGITTFVVTPEGHLPPHNTFEDPTGGNFLNTVHTNTFTSSGVEIPNTLPSTPDGRYNLHDGPVLATAIDPHSPSDDLDKLFDKIERDIGNHKLTQNVIQKTLDILEGNSIPGRAYSGMPMLHYNGPEKFKRVEPILDAAGNVVGGNVDINLVYFDQRIEADTALLDPSAVKDVPWTITYHVNILHRGMEDFSPFVMYLNDPMPDGSPGGPNVAMDQSYFPMLAEGTQYTVKIKMAPGKYYNLTYVWGWRIHPGRVQVSENANKIAGGKTLLQWEIDTFGPNPTGSEAAKLAAIAQIGELAPAKRMWTALRSLREMARGTYNRSEAQALFDETKASFLDWMDRTRLPRGVEADPDADITLFYVNNTIYGSKQGNSGEGCGQGIACEKGAENGRIHDWNIRPYTFKTTLLNGDHFMHGYVSVDFGGSRGWENQFQYTDPTRAIDPATGEPYLPPNRGGFEEHLVPTPRVADINADPQFGSGCFFTFGRVHWWMNAGGPFGAINVPPVAADGTPGLHKVQIELNYDPALRLRMYQFDPLHHDVAVYSLH